MDTNIIKTEMASVSFSCVLFKSEDILGVGW